jgi:hypothetical protein
MRIKLVILTLLEKSRKENIEKIFSIFKDIFNIEIFYGVNGKHIEMTDIYIDDSIKKN